MDLSIVIVSWNTKECLANCLDSLPAACRNLNYEVLVVDNASSDGSAEMVRTRFPGFRIVDSGGNLGFSKANNLAFPLVGGRFVLLLNPDTVATPGSFAKLIQFSEKTPNLAAVSPLLTDAAGSPTITYGFFPSHWSHWLGFVDPGRILNFGCFGRRVVHIPDRGEKSRVVDYIAGACFLMPKKVLDSVGDLDERFFMYFEETDWCFRARAAGMEVWFCAEVEVAHLEGVAAAQVNRFSIRQLQKSYRQFIRKNYGADQVWKYRLSQFAEYGLKALLRFCSPTNRKTNLVKAAAFWERASLQLVSEVVVEPPQLGEKS